MMRQIQSSSFVIGDESVGILRFQTTEVITPGKDEEIPGEPVSTDVGHLPGSVRLDLGQGAIERPALVGAADVVTTVGADEVDRLNHRGSTWLRDPERLEVQVENLVRFGEKGLRHPRSATDST